MALSAQSQLAMLAEINAEAIPLGERAAALARTLGDRRDARARADQCRHARCSAAPSMSAAAPCWRRRSRSPSRRHDDTPRARMINLATATLVAPPRRPARSRRHRARDASSPLERELDGYLQYMLGVRANLLLLRGDWPASETDARASLAFGEQPFVSLCPTLIALGRLQSRRGDPEADRDARRGLARRDGDRRAPAPGSRSPPPAPRTSGSTAT